MLDIELCRICFHLANGIKMYPIVNTRYHEIFERYTQNKMDMNEEFPYSICYLCNAKLNKLYNFLKNMIATETYFKETLRNTSKLTIESIEKFKKQTITKQQNISPGETKDTEEIKEAESQKLIEIETHKQKSKTLHSSQKETPEHSEEKSLDNEQQKPPEASKKHLKHIESETTGDQDDCACDDEDIRMTYSPDPGSPDTLTETDTDDEPSNENVELLKDYLANKDSPYLIELIEEPIENEPQEKKNKLDEIEYMDWRLEYSPNSSVCSDDQLVEDEYDVEVKIETVEEDFQGFAEENHEGDKETIDNERTEEIKETETEEVIENYGDKVSHETKNPQEMYDTNEVTGLHRRKRKVEDKMFVCCLCQESFDTKIILGKHATRHIL